MIRPTQHETRNGNRETRTRGSRGFRGFTLIELLVVVAIMILLFTIAVPGLRNLLNSGKTEQGVALISTATASIRVYANQSPAFTTGSYQGVALLFTPSNEIRYTQHVYYTSDSPGSFIIEDQEAGYVDIAREYVQLPTGIGALGLSMGDKGGSGYLHLVTPPFAIRFNPSGHLIARRTPNIAALGDYGTVFYDHDYDLRYSETALPRSNTYDPAPYDPDSPSYDENNFNTTEQKYELPFDEIETVMGVLVYDKNAFAEQGHNLQLSGGELDANARQWLLDNGETVFFNRYNGSRIRP